MSDGPSVALPAAVWRRHRSSAPPSAPSCELGRRLASARSPFGCPMAAPDLPAARDPGPRARCDCTTCAPSGGSSSAASRAPARRTWTACGTAPTSSRRSWSAALNRDALGVTRGWLRVPLQVPRTIAHRARRNTRRRQPPQHRGPLRPGQRLLSALPGRDDDLLERRVRDARPVARRCAAQQVPDPSPSAPACEPGMRVLEIGSGWGGFALYAAGELGCRRHHRSRSRRRSTSWPRSGSREPASRPRVEVELRDYRDDRGRHTTPSSRSRCSRRSAPSTSRRSSPHATERSSRAGG